MGDVKIREGMKIIVKLKRKKKKENTGVMKSSFDPTNRDVFRKGNPVSIGRCRTAVGENQYKNMIKHRIREVRKT